MNITGHGFSPVWPDDSTYIAKNRQMFLSIIKQMQAMQDALQNQKNQSSNFGNNIYKKPKLTRISR